MFAVIKYTNNMKQTNYKKSIHSLKGLFLTGLILLSSSLFAQIYDVNFKPLNFSSNNQNRISSYLSNSNQPSNQNTTLSKTLYNNVITILTQNGTQRIDCIVTNLNGTTTFDQNWSFVNNNTAPGNTSNALRVDSMFSPIVFNDASNNSKGFKFEFVIATYTISNNTAIVTNLTPVVLNNVALNIYDIDKEGSTGNVRNEVSIPKSSFTTFSALANNYQVVADPSLLIFYSRNGSTNNTTQFSQVVNDNNRYRFILNNLSSLDIDLKDINTGGNNNWTSTSSYYLAFSVGTQWTSSTTSTNNDVLLDLDGSSPDVISREVTYNTTNSTANFTVANTVNLTTNNSSTNLTNLTVKFNTADIKGGANEVLRVGTDISLNGNSSGNFNLDVTVAGTTTSTPFIYNVTTSNNGSERTITFTRSSAFTQAQAEALLDALQYVNKSTTGNIGTRIFSINATLSTPITSPTAFFTVNIPTALPVNIISFSGKATANGNQLNWTVAQEENFSHYEVLSSINGSTYNKVGEVYPENKSMDMKNYTFTDLSATADLVFYKLNLINEDGSSNFSNIVAINRNSVAPVIANVYPNPATTSLLVSLEGVDAEVSTITIQDLSGKIVYSTETSDVSTLLNINELKKGLYLIKVSNSNGIVSVSRFAKN
jgi:hypothetical protein